MVMSIGLCFIDFYKYFMIFETDKLLNPTYFDSKDQFLSLCHLKVHLSDDLVIDSGTSVHFVSWF